MRLKIQAKNCIYFYAEMGNKKINIHKITKINKIKIPKSES